MTLLKPFVLGILLFSVFLQLTGCSKEQHSSTALPNFKEESPVDSFRKFLNASVKSTETSPQSYFNVNHQKWANRKYEISDLKFDVKKTDSLVNPVIGTATFTLTTSQTDLFATKDGAETSTVYIFGPNSETVTLNFTSDKGVWKMANGFYLHPIPYSDTPSMITITPEKIAAEPDSELYAAMKYWL